MPPLSHESGHLSTADRPHTAHPADRIIDNPDGLLTMPIADDEPELPPTGE